MAPIRRLVAMGRSINGCRKIHADASLGLVAEARCGLGRSEDCCFYFLARRDASHVGVDDGREVERHELREAQTADYDETEGTARFTAGTGTERDRDGAENRGYGGHHDRAEADEAAAIDGVAGGSGAVRAVRSSAKSICMMAFFLTMPTSMIRPTNE